MHWRAPDRRRKALNPYWSPKVKEQIFLYKFLKASEPSKGGEKERVVKPDLGTFEFLAANEYLLKADTTRMTSLAPNEVAGIR